MVTSTSLPGVTSKPLPFIKPQPPKQQPLPTSNINNPTPSASETKKPRTGGGGGGGSSPAPKAPAPAPTQDTVIINNQGYSVAPELQKQFIEQKTQQTQRRSGSVTSQIEQNQNSIQPGKGYIDTKNRPGVPGIGSATIGAIKTGIKDVGIGLGIVKGKYENPWDSFEGIGTAKADKQIKTNTNPVWRGTISNQNIPGYEDTSKMTYGQLEQKRLIGSGVPFDLVGVPEKVRVDRTIERAGKATGEAAQKEYDALSQSIYEQKQIEVFGGKDVNVAQSEYESENVALKSKIEEKYNKQFESTIGSQIGKIQSASAYADITGGRLGETTGDVVKRIGPEVVKTGAILAGSLSSSPLIFGTTSILSGGIMATQSLGKAAGNEDITTGERVKLYAQGALGLGIIGFGVGRAAGLNRESLLSMQYEKEILADAERQTIRISGREVYKSEKGAAYLLRGERSTGPVTQETTFTLKSFRNVKPDVYAKSESGIPTLIEKGKESYNSIITGGKSRTTVYNFLSGKTKTSINNFGSGSKPVTTGKTIGFGSTRSTVKNVLGEGELTVSEGYVKIKGVSGFKKSYSFSLVKEEEDVYKVASGKLVKARLSSSGKASVIGKGTSVGTIKKLKLSGESGESSSNRIFGNGAKQVTTQKNIFDLSRAEEALSSSLKPQAMPTFQKQSILPSASESLPGPDAIAKGIKEGSSYYGKGSLQLEEQDYGLLNVQMPSSKPSISQGSSGSLVSSGDGGLLIVPTQVDLKKSPQIVGPLQMDLEKESLINRPRLKNINNHIENVYQLPSSSSIQLQSQQYRLATATKLRTPQEQIQGFDFGFDYNFRLSPPRGKLSGRIKFDNPLLESESFGRSRKSKRKYGYAPSLSASVLGIKGKPMSIGSDVFGKLYGAGMRPIPIYGKTTRKKRKQKI